MDIPPLLAITGGIVVVGLCFLLRIPMFLLGILSVVLLAYTLMVHQSMFAIEYATMSLPQFLTSNAPLFMILAVIIFSLGYILYLFGPRGAVSTSTMAQPSFFSRIFGQATSTRPQQRRSSYNNYDPYERDI